MPESVKLSPWKHVGFFSEPTVMVAHLAPTGLNRFSRHGSQQNKQSDVITDVGR